MSSPHASLALPPPAAGLPCRQRPRLAPPRLVRAALIALAAGLAGCVAAPPATPPQAPAASATPAGEVKGNAWRHTPASARAAVEGAQVALPARVTGTTPFVGRWRDAPLPPAGAPRVPVVVFLHGSSGLALKAIEEWQRWLADRGVASVAPDSFALPDRLTYKSPVDKATYERIHALRASEVELARAAVASAPWADTARLLLAGTSEGAVAVARHAGPGFAGRMLYAWSCEDNYFVDAHRTAAAGTAPVLNVISTSDPFFSATNAWVGTAGATRGHCGAVFAHNPQATVVLVGAAPHTLLNLPAARDATAAFLTQVVRP